MDKSILYMYIIHIIIRECWQCLAEVMILILSLQHIRFSSFWPAVLQMACECLRRLLKPIKSMARFHTTVKCGLILYVHNILYSFNIYIERVSVYYLLHVILVKNFQLLLTTQWPPQHTGLEDLCNAFLGNPFLASTPMGLAEGGRKISQELSVKRTVCLNLKAA